MYKKYDVYKFATNEIYTSTSYLKRCEQDLVDFHQKKVNKLLKKNKDKANEYLDKISMVNSLLQENHDLLDNIVSELQKIEENVNKMEYAEANPDKVKKIDTSSKKKEKKIEVKEPTKKEEPVDDKFDKLVAKANKIKEVGRVYYNNLKNIAYEANELLNNYNTSKEYNEISVFDTECKHLYHLSTDMSELLYGIKLSDGDSTSTIEMIKNAIKEEEERSDFISSEAYKIICLGAEEATNNGALDMFCSLVRNEYSKILDKTNEVDNMAMEINADSSTDIEKTAINMLQEIIDEEGRKVRSSLIKLEKLIDRPTINAEPNKVIDFGEVKVEDDDDELTRKVKQMLNYAKSNDSDYKKIYNKFIEILNPESYEERLSLPTIYPDSEKDADTKEYQKNIDIQNKSFWEARSIASAEGIKFPSAEYERKVREYQNEWLLEKHKVSLEELYDKIEEYEEKYAEDLYIKRIYNSSLKRLREESSMSISELCDESFGLSLLDKKAYELLENDLTEVIKEIGQTKKTEEVTSSIAVADYRKNMKLDKLIDRKEMIEREMYLLRKRAEKIEKEAE